MDADHPDRLMPPKSIRGATKFEVSRPAFVAEGGEWSELLDAVAAGKSLYALCREKLWSYREIRRWIDEQPERKTEYAQAERIYAECKIFEGESLADEADPDTVNVAKLRIETKRKIAGFLDRDRWGEKSESVALGLENLAAVLQRISERKQAGMREIQDVTPIEHISISDKPVLAAPERDPEYFRL